VIGWKGAGGPIKEEPRGSFESTCRRGNLSLHDEEENSGVRLQRLSSPSEVAKEELVAQDIWVCELLVYFEVLHLEREVISVGHCTD
jgi:hypothetical protein